MRIQDKSAITDNECIKTTPSTHTQSEEKEQSSPTDGKTCSLKKEVVAAVCAGGIMVGGCKSEQSIAQSNLPKYKKGNPIGQSFEDLSIKQLEQDLKQQTGKDYSIERCPAYKDGPDFIATNRENPSDQLKIQAKCCRTEQHIAGATYHKHTQKCRYEDQTILVPHDTDTSRLNKEFSQRDKNGQGSPKGHIQSSVTYDKAKRNAYRENMTSIVEDIKNSKQPVLIGMGSILLMAGIYEGLRMYKQKKKGNPIQKKELLKRASIWGGIALLTGILIGTGHVIHSQSLRPSYPR